MFELLETMESGTEAEYQHKEQMISELLNRMIEIEDVLFNIDETKEVIASQLQHIMLTQDSATLDTLKDLNQQSKTVKELVNNSLQQCQLQRDQLSEIRTTIGDADMPKLVQSISLGIRDCLNGLKAIVFNPIPKSQETEITSLKNVIQVLIVEVLNLQQNVKLINITVGDLV